MNYTCNTSCGAPVYGSTAGGGRTRSCVLKGLLPGRVYSFQLVPYTGTLNSNAVFGPFSNIAKVSLPFGLVLGQC